MSTHAERLNVADLTVGREVLLHVLGKPPERYRIESDVAGRAIIARRLFGKTTQGFSRRIDLAEWGVLPNANGQWHETNHVTAT